MNIRPPLLSDRIRRIAPYEKTPEGFAILQEMASQAETLEVERTRLYEALQIAVDALAEIGSLPTHCGDPDWECPLQDLGNKDHAITAALSTLAGLGVTPTKP